MSVEAAKQLYVRLMSDRDFTARLDATASPEDRIALARGHGYDFTQDEFETATGELLEAESPEAFFGADGDTHAFAALAGSFLGIQRATGIGIYGVGYFYLRQTPAGEGGTAGLGSFLAG